MELIKQIIILLSVGCAIFYTLEGDYEKATFYSVMILIME